MPIKRFYRYGVRALATAVLAIGTLVATGTAAHADPQVIRCVRTAPGFVLGAGQYGSAWVTTGTLVRTVYNVDNVPVNCLYRGEEYSWTWGGTTVDEGPYSFWRPLFEFI